MSDGRRKTNKQYTGTVPKVKHRNNASSFLNEPDRSRSLANNLTGYWQHPPDSTNIIRNPRRNHRNNYFPMNTTLEEPNFQLPTNGCISFNLNESGSTNTSSSTSRRNSSGSTLKCDNVTKYPDKKQIEDKLHQLQEYLKITNSLMTTMKNTDDQMNISEKENLEKMIIDLKDSEKKLYGVLDLINAEERKGNIQNQVIENGVDNSSEHSASSNIRNEVDINLDHSKQEMDFIREQQLPFLQLQQKAENKLKDARQIQSNLLLMQGSGDSNGLTNHKDCKNLADFDAAIKELEDRAIRLGPTQQTANQKMQENILAKVESLHNQILCMHNANDEREQLIEVLDNRDAELRSHHEELQTKLMELQNKKSQVDQLVSQLQSYSNEDEDDDMGGQVRNIVTMKDQLKKLKDMLEIVKTTENIITNTNASSEAQAVAFETCSMVESFLEKDTQKPKLGASVQNESNVLRYDNDTSSEGRPKQVNKNKRDQASRGVKPKMPSVSQKSALQSELESKKRELEDLMGKHKASTSNLNHDVGLDTKSEFSCASNTVNEAWLPLIPSQNQQTDSDRFSSDDCQDDVNDYAELHENHNILSLPNPNYSPSNSSKHRSENTTQIEYVRPLEYDRSRGISRTPDRNVRSSSVATSGYIREQPRSNSEQDNKTQVQKQLQLIKSVCDSMLEQQSSNLTSNVNVQQLRNNLTPSPLYSEPRRFASPNPHTQNSLNVAVNPVADAPLWFPNSRPNPNSDIDSYQSWLAANAIQTQSFMLNTLNQCCQMLWLQQRELVSLRNAVTLLQERPDVNHYPGSNEPMNPSIQTTPQLDHQRSTTNLYRPSISNQKTNHVSAAFSMPNLNHYNSQPANNMVDPSQFINHQNNIQSGRLLDPICLNNTNVNQQQQQQQNTNNSVLHDVNINHHPLPNQMWNGQALNNQVAPGNRANNYWDNFRSYSRQNLLSTKNEILQNPPSSLDRSNTLNERTNPFSLMSLSKCNSEQDSTSTSQENTPQRRGQYRHENVNSLVIPPPDVLNVNHRISSKTNGHLDLQSHHTENVDDVNMSFQTLLSLNAGMENSSNRSNISEDHPFKECTIPEQCERRNDWNDDVNEENPQKSKLFEELRENVYKEVASLISANEARPHFLIQLFRDLQMIGSDSLRLKILQSIQMVITHSVLSSQNPNRHSLDSQQNSTELDAPPSTSDSFSLQSTVWSKPTKNTSHTFKNNDYTEYQNFVKGALPFLSDREDEIIQSSLLTSLKQILLGSGTLREAVQDTVFVKYFSNILDEVFEQYRGKKVRDVKVHLLQTLNELLCGELGFILFIQENNPENCISHLNSNIEHETSNFSPSTFEYQKSASKAAENIQNGDLAEADQSRVMDEDIEEEGAVGGIFEAKTEINSGHQSTCDDRDIATCNVESTCDMDMTCVDVSISHNAEGLDQVPTRLPTKVKSRSTTPNKDRSSSRSDPDNF